MTSPTAHTPPPDHEPIPSHKSDRSEKKMMGGSLAVSVVIHALILLIIGSIVIVPAAVEKFMPVTSVAPPPMEIPEPPPLDQTPVDVMEEAGGSPIGDVQETTSTTDQSPSDIDALVVDTPNSSAPSLNASSSTGSSVSGDVFGRMGSSEGAAGSGSGTGATGKGTGKTTFFGTTVKTKAMLVGSFYDSSRYRDGKAVGIGAMGYLGQLMKQFVEKGGSPSSLRDAWKSKQVLYATQVTIPACDNEELFESFDEKISTPNPAFLLHYTGQIALPSDTTFRFNGTGNDCVIVLVDGKPMLITENSGQNWQTNTAVSVPAYESFGWKPTENLLSNNTTNRPSYDRYTFGTWMTWKANEYHRIDILVGNAAAGFDSWIFVEDKGKTHKKLDTGIPILPIFRISAKKLEPRITKHYTAASWGLDERGGMIFLCK